MWGRLRSARMGTGSGDTGRRIGGFEIEDLLGRGGMGTVYKAHQTSLGRRVALKVIRPELRLDDEVVARFRREARAGALTHPHIVSVYDVGEDGEDLYIAMAYLPGGSLADRLEAAGPLPPDQAERIGHDIESALAFAHSQGIVHRDVKPSNILFDAADNAVLADFGVAAVTGLTTLTSTRAVVGTPSYMAPELTRGEAATPASDLYALGCTLYEAVSGRPPFTGQDALAVLVQHRSDEPPALPEDCPTALRSRIATLLAKDPKERTTPLTGIPEHEVPSVAAVATTAGGQQWAIATHSLTPADRAPPKPPPPSDGTTTRPLWRRLAVIGSVAALLVVGVVIVISQPDDESASSSPPAETRETTTTVRVNPTTTVEPRAQSTAAVPATVPPPPGLPEAPWDAPAVNPPADLAEAASTWASSPFPGCSLFAPTRMASDGGYTPAFFPQFTRIGGFDVGWDGTDGHSVWMTVWPSDNQNVSRYYDDPAPEIFSDGSERRRIDSPLLIDALISIPGEPCVYQVSCDSMFECDLIFSSFRRITT